MNQERSQLLQTIIDNPDDDTPRLVYADWLEENEESERGEFIRLQIDIAKIEEILSEPFEYGDFCTGICAVWCPVCGDCCCPNREERMDYDRCPLHSPMSRHGGDKYGPRSVKKRLKSRERDVIFRKWLAWTPDLGENVRLACGNRESFANPTLSTGDQNITITFRRGFVDSVSCTIADWYSYGYAIVRHEPIRPHAGMVTDREPVEIETMGFRWYSNNHDEINPQAPGNIRAYVGSVFELIRPSESPARNFEGEANNWSRPEWFFATADAAKMALAEAIIVRARQ